MTDVETGTRTQQHYVHLQFETGGGWPIGNVAGLLTSTQALVWLLTPAFIESVQEFYHLQSKGRADSAAFMYRNARSLAVAQIRLTELRYSNPFDVTFSVPYQYGWMFGGLGIGAGALQLMRRRASDFA